MGAPQPLAPHRLPARAMTEQVGQVASLIMTRPPGQTLILDQSLHTNELLTHTPGGRAVGPDSLGVRKILEKTRSLRKRVFFSLFFGPPKGSGLFAKPTGTARRTKLEGGG